jgi:hypothetical protein
MSNWGAAISTPIGRCAAVELLELASEKNYYEFPLKKRNARPSPRWHRVSLLKRVFPRIFVLIQCQFLIPVSRESENRMLKFLFGVTLLSALLSTGAIAQNPPTIPPSTATSIPIGVSPSTVQPVNGKLPSSMLLAIFAKNCDENSKENLTPYTVRLTGAGLTLSEFHYGKCAITSTLTIDPSTPPGIHKVFLTDISGSMQGIADFAVVDIAAGAIPPGLPPQVDVMWEVLSQSVCNDVFGKRVARNFYCIEVKIGNNTGHSLQIAGIGFAKHLDTLPGTEKIIQSNTSYASTRAVLLRESVLSPRNVFYHSLQATGLLMGAFIPYFVNPVAAKHFATAASIVSGPLLEGFNLIGPDRVVGQLNNLDDQSFRDNQIIPNNAHIRTLIFVEKRALTESIALLSDQVSAPDRQESHEFRDEFKAQAKRTQNNSKQQDIHPLLRTARGDHSPLLVKLALGNLVIVGDEIEYLQRLQVQSSSSLPSNSSLTLSTSKLVFSDQAVGTKSAVQSVTITNSGTASLNGIVIGITGTHKAAFSETNTCSDTSLAAKATCTISLTFAPNQQDSNAATLNIAYAGNTSPQTVSLAGTGVTPIVNVSLSPAILDFGSQKSGIKSGVKSATLINSGGVPLNNLSLSTSGKTPTDFSQTNTCGTTVPAGASCTVSLTFTPSSTGSSTATLTVTYNAGGTQQTKEIKLSGKGQ